MEFCEHCGESLEGGEEQCCVCDEPNITQHPSWAPWDPDRMATDLMLEGARARLRMKETRKA